MDSKTNLQSSWAVRGFEPITSCPNVNQKIAYSNCFGRAVCVNHMRHNAVRRGLHGLKGEYEIALVSTPEAAMATDGDIGPGAPTGQSGLSWAVIGDE